MFIPPRPVALTMPIVTVCPIPNGLPSASTTSPTSSLSLSANVMNGRSFASIFNTAMSVLGSRPTTLAVNCFLSLSRATLISSAPNGWPKNRRKNGSSKNGVTSGHGFLTVLVVKTLTTLGATFFTTGEKLAVNFVCRPSGVPLTATVTVGRLLPERSNPPLAATHPAAATPVSSAMTKLFFNVMCIIYPFWNRIREARPVPDSWELARPLSRFSFHDCDEVLICLLSEESTWALRFTNRVLSRRFAPTFRRHYKFLMPVRLRQPSIVLLSRADSRKQAFQIDRGFYERLEPSRRRPLASTQPDFVSATLSLPASGSFSGVHKPGPGHVAKRQTGRSEFGQRGQRDAHFHSAGPGRHQ